MESKKRTILVVYSNDANIDVKRTTLKKYSFNTEDDLKPGDMITSPSYDTNLVVVKVLDEAFRYFNFATGELTNEYGSSRLGEIRDLKMLEASEVEVIFAVKVDTNG